MAESIIYQLNCNQRHDKCFYIKLKKSKAHIIILGYNNSRYYLLRSLLASFHPISSGWVGENIFLLSESSLYILTIPSFTLVQVPLPAYKIIDILWINPCSTDTHLNLRCVQLSRLYLRKSLYIRSIFRMIFRISCCYGKFLTHITA